jgi:ABC-type transport system involved in multi-copper enzyme maturation permease subunit
MFASALAIERDPLSYANVPEWIVTFLQDAGGFAAFGLAVWALAYLITRLTTPRGATPATILDPFGGFVRLGTGTPGQTDVEGLNRTLARAAGWLRRLFVLLILAALVVYGLLALIKLPEFLAWFSAFLAGEPYASGSTSKALQQLIDVGLMIGGSCALAAVLLPFVVDLLRLRWRRIWALTKLTILEVIRRRVIWVFLGLALVFLFGTWFIDSKPENQVRSYVQVVYLAMAILILFTTSLLASFSLPTDISQNTIHTIVTKPVERYEIFLGRFLGYTLVMTVVLAVMTGFSCLYVLRGVDPDAARESLKARVPLYGTLSYEGTPDANKGENVGEEWEYRGYISGPMGGGPAAPQYAIWELANLPSSLANRPGDKVTCEYTFAIYRTTIGELNKGVFCSFTGESWLWDPANRGELEAERKRLKDAQKSDEEIQSLLAEKYGIYELGSKEVTNYHTQAFDLPCGLFRNYFLSREEVRKEVEQLHARQQNGPALSPAETRRLTLLEKDVHGDPRPPLRIRVRCISRTQFVGMARYDLYLLDREEPFLINFFKGAAGVWFWTELVVSVALACSTWLSGVISWICVVFLFLVGMFRDFVLTVAAGTNVGGGPSESLVRLIGKQSLALPMESGTVTNVVTGSDELFRWVMRRFIDVIPDVDRYDFSSVVANGFNVSGGTLGLTLLFLAGYLLLWLVLAYYLIKSREIAIPS